MGWIRPKVSSRWPSYDGGSEGTAMISSPPERGCSWARANGPGAITTTTPRPHASSTPCHHPLRSSCIAHSRVSHTDTGRPMAWLDFSELGDHALALCDSHRAAWVEDAAGGRVRRAWHLPPEDNALTVRLYLGVRDGHCC